MPVINGFRTSSRLDPRIPEAVDYISRRGADSLTPFFRRQIPPRSGFWPKHEGTEQGFSRLSSVPSRQPEDDRADEAARKAAQEPRSYNNTGESCCPWGPFDTCSASWRCEDDRNNLSPPPKRRSSFRQQKRWRFGTSQIVSVVSGAASLPLMVPERRLAFRRGWGSNCCGHLHA